MTTHELHVPAGPSGGGYSVLVGAGLALALPDLLCEHAPAHRYAVISDSTVARLHGPSVVGRMANAGLNARLFPFPAGEENKRRARWAELTDRLLESGLGRDAVVVALGGGVTGDLAGFVAATYMRGIPVVQVPTTLVAMIDASVGGKVGVNVSFGKNLVGAFHPPRLVVADPEFAATLSPDERAQGLVEAIKHGALADDEHLADLERSWEPLLAGDVAATARVVRRSVEIKAEVVSEDEREVGRRAILNFGHTLGHALESGSGYRIRHGTAVAAGMVLEARIGERMGVTQSGTSARLARALTGLGAALSLQSEVSAPRLIERARRDKKARAGRSRYVLLERIGRVAPGEGWTHAVPDEVVREVLEGTP